MSEAPPSAIGLVWNVSDVFVCFAYSLVVVQCSCRFHALYTIFCWLLMLLLWLIGVTDWEPCVFCRYALPAVGIHLGLPAGEAVRWPSPAISVPLPWDVSALTTTLMSAEYTTLPLSAVHLWLLGVQRDVEAILVRAFDAMLTYQALGALGFVPRVGNSADARQYTTPLGVSASDGSAVIEFCSWYVIYAGCLLVCVLRCLLVCVCACVCVRVCV